MSFILRKKSRRARKALGQTFLINEPTLDYEVAMARVEGAKVLEIGGGTGNLSERLAEQAKKLAIVEKDTALISLLKSKFSGKRKVEIIEGDFLTLGPKEFGSKIDVIIGNIPYSISSPILFRLRDWAFDRALLCVQKEFAERMVAKPGEKGYSRLSVMTQLYFKPIFLRVVPKGYFSPVPEVDSALVFLTKRDEAIHAERDKFIEHLFSHGKNTLHAAFRAREMKEIYPNAPAAAQQLNLEKRRVHSLAIEELNKLFEGITAKKRRR
jgi:16S rRNA (adenine1518-N6/adenine1519-N6)-dimethyltransferase